MFLWETETETKREVGRLVLGADVLSFSPRDDWLATASGGEKAVRIWQVESGQELTRLSSDKVVRSLAFSPEGRWLAATERKGTQVWDARNGEQVTGTALKGGVFSRSDPWLAASSAKDAIQVWEGSTGREIVRLPQANTGPLAMSPDGRWVAATSEDGSTRIWEVVTGVVSQFISPAISQNISEWKTPNFPH